MVPKDTSQQAFRTGEFCYCPRGDGTVPRCVVTGVAGFIGSHLAEALLNQGHSVVGVDCFTDYYSKRIKTSNLSALRKVKGFRLVRADLSTVDLSPITRGADYVFHLAAQPGVRGAGAVLFHTTSGTTSWQLRDSLRQSRTCAWGGSSTPLRPRYTETQNGCRLQKMQLPSPSLRGGFREPPSCCTP